MVAVKADPLREAVEHLKLSRLLEEVGAPDARRLSQTMRGYAVSELQQAIEEDRRNYA